MLQSDAYSRFIPFLQAQFKVFIRKMAPKTIVASFKKRFAIQSTTIATQVVMQFKLYFSAQQHINVTYYSLSNVTLSLVISLPLNLFIIFSNFKQSVN